MLSVVAGHNSVDSPLGVGRSGSTPIERHLSPGRIERDRRDPRTKYLGFTSRQWPFLFVLVGNWIFALGFFLGVKLVWHWVPAEWSTSGDKIALVFKCAAFALLPGIVGICIVSAERSRSHDVGRANGQTQFRFGHQHALHLEHL